MNAEHAFAQGQLFYTQNTSWLQPPGHVFRMLKDSHRDYVVATNRSGLASGIDAIAVANADLSQIVVRIVNYIQGGAPASVSLNFGSGAWTPQQLATAQVLSGGSSFPDPDAQNTPWAPDAFSPQSVVVDVTKPITVLPLSFTVITILKA